MTHPEAVGERDEFTAQHWNLRGIGVYVAPPVGGLPTVAHESQRLTGRAINDLDWARLAGAPDGAMMTVAVHHMLGFPGVRITVDHPWYATTADRFMYRDHAGKLIIENILFVKRRGTETGIGIRVLAQQVQAAVEFGVSRIELDAGGRPRSPLNGYYTWAVTGFDGLLPLLALQKLRALPVTDPKRGVTTVRELLAIPKDEPAGVQGGVSWWRENGSEYRASFDLADGSWSRRILSR